MRLGDNGQIIDPDSDARELAAADGPETAADSFAEGE